MSDAAPASPRVVLVETSDALPGLLPFQAWDALGTAEVVWVRDRAAHPSAQHLYAAGLDLEDLAPTGLDRGDLDLTRPGAPDDRRYAKALAERALGGEVPVFLLGPEDTGIAPALAGMAAERDLEIELVFFAPQPEGTEVLRLVEVMRRLRDPENGCPWDLQQDHSTLVTYLLEEAYELVEAIEDGQDVDLIEELGDVLLQVVFHAQVGRDRQAFGIDDVARGIADKLERRHPHVFGDGDAETAEQVQANWDRLKAREKSRTGAFDGVPDLMAALMLLDTLQRKAAKHGVVGRFPTQSAMREELDRLLPAVGEEGPPAEAAEGGDDGQRSDPTEAAVADLLDGLVAVAREHGVDPEQAGRLAARRFRARVEQLQVVASARGLDLTDVDEATMAELWEASVGDT